MSKIFINSPIYHDFKNLFGAFCHDSSKNHLKIFSESLAHNLNSFLERFRNFGFHHKVSFGHFFKDFSGRDARTAPSSILKLKIGEFILKDIDMSQIHPKISLCAIIIKIQTTLLYLPNLFHISFNVMADAHSGISVVYCFAVSPLVRRKRGLASAPSIELS